MPDERWSDRVMASAAFEAGLAEAGATSVCSTVSKGTVLAGGSVAGCVPQGSTGALDGLEGVAIQKG